MKFPLRKKIEKCILIVFWFVDHDFYIGSLLLVSKTNVIQTFRASVYMESAPAIPDMVICLSGAPYSLVSNMKWQLIIWDTVITHTIHEPTPSIPISDICANLSNIYW